MDNKGDRTYGIMLICPECGKQFNCYNQGKWAYKRTYDNKIKTFCSWNCMRRFEKREDEKFEVRRREGGKNHWRGKRITS